MSVSQESQFKRAGQYLNLKKRLLLQIHIPSSTELYADQTPLQIKRTIQRPLWGTYYWSF